MPRLGSTTYLIDQGTETVWQISLALANSSLSTTTIPICGACTLRNINWAIPPSNSPSILDRRNVQMQIPTRILFCRSICGHQDGLSRLGQFQSRTGGNI